MCDRSVPLDWSSLRTRFQPPRLFARCRCRRADYRHGGHAHAAEAHIKSIHGSGFCNLNYFLTEAKQFAKDDGVILDFVLTPTSAEMVTFLGAGQVDAGLLIPASSHSTTKAQVKIVAGGGIQGCVLVAQPGLDAPEKLKGKTLGTFQLDTLEVLPYDWLKKHSVSFRDINLRSAHHRRSPRERRWSWPAATRHRGANIDGSALTQGTIGGHCCRQAAGGSVGWEQVQMQSSLLALMAVFCEVAAAIGGVGPSVYY